MKTIQLGAKATGSTLIVALLTLAVLSVVGATVLMNVTTRYGYTQQAIGWEDALSAAEAGVDYGLANCRATIVSGSPTPWVAWQKYDSSTQAWVTVASTADATNELTAGRRIIYDLPAGSTLIGTGQGTTSERYHVEVDAPATLKLDGNPCYRIRATGYAALTGPARVGNDNPNGAKTHNDILRKLDLRFDHFITRYGDYAHPPGASVSVNPQATRRVEVIARPKTSFEWAIMATDTVGRPLASPLVDSYDSTDTVHYPGGLYNPTSRDVATGVGVNAPVYVNAPISQLNTTVYGNVTTANGTLTNNGKITGTIQNNGTLDMPTVSAPTWGTVGIQPAPATIYAGSTSTPSYSTYSSANNITILPPVGQTKGVANLYVTGNVTGGITVAAGVTVKIWMTGNFSMQASKINNLNFNAANLQVYGIDPAAGQSRGITISPGGPGYAYIAFDCPSYDYNTPGNPDLCGAIIAKTINGNGNTTWHYDEALATAGLVTDYKRASWVEDER